MGKVHIHSYITVRLLNSVNSSVTSFVMVGAKIFHFFSV